MQKPIINCIPVKGKAVKEINVFQDSCGIHLEVMYNDGTYDLHCNAKREIINEVR